MDSLRNSFDKKYEEQLARVEEADRKLTRRLSPLKHKRDSDMTRGNTPNENSMENPCTMSDGGPQESSVELAEMAQDIAKKGKKGILSLSNVESFVGNSQVFDRRDRKS